MNDTDQFIAELEEVRKEAEKNLKTEAIATMRSWIEYKQEIESLKKRIRHLKEAQEREAEQLVKIDVEMAKKFENRTLGEFMLVRGNDGYFYLFHMDRFDHKHSIQQILPMIKKADLVSAAQ